MYPPEEGPETAGADETGTASVFVPTGPVELALPGPLGTEYPDVGTASGAVLLGDDGDEAPLDGRPLEPE